VIRRAQTLWPLGKVEYSMNPPFRDRWRRDCSGFVSMCFDIPADTPGFFGGMNTVSFVTAGLFRRIEKADLQPGDVIGLLGPGTAGADGHIVIFEGWADPEHKSYSGFEQVHGGPKNRPIGYPYDDDDRDFQPYRYQHFDDDDLEDRMYHQQLIPGPHAVTVLLFPFSSADSPAFSIGTDTQAGTNMTRAQWRVMLHVADKGWQTPPGGQALLVTDSADGRRHDIACPKGTDRASIQRMPIDGQDQCQVPAAVLAWW
jgi:hypothetical protein